MLILFSTLDKIIIVCSTLGGALFLLLVVFLLDKMILKKRRCHRILTDVEKKYEYLNSLLLGQDLNYIQRLEIISRTNLLYGDIHSTYFRRFKEIRDNQDQLYLEILNELKSLYEQKNYKEFKNYYNERNTILTHYEESVNLLDSDLYAIIKPEEDARQNVLLLKERFREVKSKYNANENDLSYLHDSFYKVFDMIDSQFNQYDGYVESANYDEASSMVPKMNKILESLLSMMDKAPNYIDELLNILPKEIDEITNNYRELLSLGYPLRSLNIEDIINSLHYCVENSVNNLKNLRFTDIETNINNMHAQINEVKSSFADEQKSKEEFESNIKNSSERFVSLEKEYIKISNTMSKINKFYVVDEKHSQDFNDLSDKVNEVSKEKRKMEVYIHQKDSIPYKALVDRMAALDNGTNDLNDRITAFKNYLATLKNDSEKAYNLINILYFKLKKYESLVENDIKEKTLVDNFKNTFADCYKYMDNIYSIIKVIPIDVNEVNVNVNKLNNISNTLFIEIDKLLNFKNEAEKNILIANKERYKFTDVNALVDQAEDLYENGNYKLSFEISNESIEKIKLKDGYNRQ